MMIAEAERTRSMPALRRRRVSLWRMCVEFMVWRDVGRYSLGIDTESRKKESKDGVRWLKS